MSDAIAPPDAASTRQTARLANFIIGGTEKAGTTSVFDNLGVHPQVCASTRKETDFFRHDYSGDPAADARRYAAFFDRCAPGLPVLMEASPGYLGEAATVAPRLRALVPGVKLLFILRDPVARFHSSYQFHRARLNLPQELGFGDYLQRCLDFDRGVLSARDAGLDEWYLKVLRFGCYAECLELYRLQLPAANLKVMFFESLLQDERAFMVELSGFLGIDRAFWTNYQFRRSNITFSGRNHTLHRLAMHVNALAEPLLRRYPGLKRALLRAYKTVNEEREGYDPMPAAVRQRLVEYYGPSARALQRQLGTALPDSWQYLLREAQA
jgi:hypothetical protein